MHSDSLRIYIGHLQESYRFLSHKLVRIKKQHDTAEVKLIQKLQLRVKSDLVKCRQRLSDMLN